MGRPLGTRNHPDFQMKVLRKSLSWLESNSGPVLLEIFGEEAPVGKDESSEEAEGWTCPVNPPLPPSDKSELETTLLAEMASLLPWYDLSTRKRGGSSAGTSPRSIEKIAKVFVKFLDGDRENSQPELSLGDALKLASEDLKAWYMEAATAQPGHSTSAQIQNWFWGETTAGAILLELCGVFAICDDPMLPCMSSSALVPRSQRFRLK